MQRKTRSRWNLESACHLMSGDHVGVEAAVGREAAVPGQASDVVQVGRGHRGGGSRWMQMVPTVGGQGGRAPTLCPNCF